MELNPNHPMTSTMRDQWHKMCLLLMHKLGETHVVITARDIQSAVSMFGGPMPAITIRELPDGIHLELISEVEGAELARKEGGLAN